jgi:hypothetical protein
LLPTRRRKPRSSGSMPRLRTPGCSLVIATTSCAWAIP